MNGHPLVRRIADRLDTLAGPADRTDDGERPRGLLVGFSGGPDSLLLLLAAVWWGRRTGSRVEAAHLHHGLRGTDADADLDFCRTRCADLGVPLHERAVDPRPVAARRGRGLEEAARHVRQGWLQELVTADPGLDLIALGHHRDDQAETVLMRLFRGTGPDGLAGMRPRRGNVIRPLLEVDRHEILGCLAELGETWRQDATNLSGDNLRAVMRRKLVPVLEEVFGPGAPRRPLRVADLLAGDLDLLQHLTDLALARARCPGDPDALLRAPLLAEDPALAARVLRRWLGTPTDGAADGPAGGEESSPDAVGEVHIRAILAWLREGQSGGGLDLPGGLRLVREFDRLRLERGPAPVAVSAEDFRIRVTESAATEPGEQTGRREGMGERIGNRWRIHCPAAALRGNLRVDHPRPGDRLRPLGLEGSKKLSDVLREARVPASARPGVLVVRDAAGILWVVGVARDERTRLLPTGGKIVTIDVIERRPTS